MKPILSPSLTVLAVFAASLLPVVAAEPNADQLLKQMSAKLAAAHTFRFEATREIDPALLEGRNVPEKAHVTVAVQRPNHLAARAVSKTGARRFVFNGRTLTLLDEKPNHYATVPAATTIDGLVDQLEAKYGFVPPLADFAVSNPYREIRQQAHTVTYLGRGKASACPLGICGVDCDRIGLKGKAADAQLWIAESDGLPRKLVATFHRAGHPQVRITFSKWNLAAPVTAGEFNFTPPKGAQKIEMWTTAKMQAAAKH